MAETAKSTDWTPRSTLTVSFGRVVQICVHSMFTGSGHTCSCNIVSSLSAAISTWFEGRNRSYFCSIRLSISRRLLCRLLDWFIDYDAEMRTFLMSCLLVLATLTYSLSIVQADTTYFAVASLRGSYYASQVLGYVTFHQPFGPGSVTRIVANISGMPSGVSVHSQQVKSI